MNDDELRGLFEGLRQEVRQEIGSVRAEIGSVREVVGSVRQETDSIRQELGSARAEVGSVREETRSIRAEMAAMREENAAEHAKTRAYTETLVGSLRHEMTIRFEHVDHNLELLAESVVGIHERIDRETADIRTEMREGFAHTHSMMKTMYGDLHQS